MKYITPLILIITFTLTAFSADKKVPKVAAKDWCFIAPDGGKKWHAERGCRSLKKSTNVKYVTLEDAKKLGKDEKKWVDGCYFCWGKHQKKK